MLGDRILGPCARHRGYSSEQGTREMATRRQSNSVAQWKLEAGGLGIGVLELGTLVT